DGNEGVRMNMVVDTQGRLVVLAVQYNGAARLFRVVTDGQLDLSFGDAGIIDPIELLHASPYWTTDAFCTYSAYLSVLDVAVDSTDRVILGGSSFCVSESAVDTAYHA